MARTPRRVHRRRLRQDASVAPALAPRPASFRRLLRRPRYPGFVLTVSLSRTSSAMFNTAGVLLVLARTGSAPLAGLTAAATVVPGELTGPVLGAWLDVVNRRRLLVVLDQLLLSLIHISEPTRLGMISYAVFCL